MAADRVGAASSQAVRKAVDSMRRLNRYAAEKIHGYEVSACTDITGFGLLCHLLEMCGGNVSVEVWPEELPVFSEASQYAGDYLLTAAGQCNRNYFSANGAVDKLPFTMQEIMFDPQTSGGLLICVNGEQSAELLAVIQKDDPAARIIGRVLPPQDNRILFKG